MTAVRVCTDSSALIPESDAARLGVAVVPVRVMLDGELPDEREVDAFYERTARGAVATTSRPSPGELLAAYVAAAEQGVDEVLSVHLDARVSGVVSSAELAARESSIPVTVVDSGTTSYGVGICARAGAEAIAAGASGRDAAVLARQLGSRLRNLFVAAAAPVGRVGRGNGWAVLELADGRTRQVRASHTPEDAVTVMATEVSVDEQPVRVAVGHAAAELATVADELASLIGALPHVVGVERYRVAPAVGAHTGPLTFGAFWWPAEPR
ncbi:MAG: DegV family protein [Gaiellaceae bacterium]